MESNAGMMIWQLIIAALAILAVSIMGWVLIHRTRHVRRKRRLQKRRELLNASFIHYLVDERDLTHATGYDRILKLAGKGHQQEIIDVAHTIVTHVRGNTAKRVRAFYVSTGLVEVSLKKLTSRDHYQLITGMRELAAMEYKEGVTYLLPLLHHTDPIVRTEAHIAVVHLADDPLFFMKKVKNFVIWEQINVLNALKMRTANSIPPAGTWLSSPDILVVQFCLLVIVQFDQRECLPEIHELLKSDNQRRVYLALLAIQKLKDSRSQRPVKELLLSAKNQTVRKLAMTVLHELSGPVQWLAISEELKKTTHLRLTA